ncbi:hypothetical protein [Anaeromicropila herbilytica]|uniref:Uncharacterized protein n=1 Tax=Anaeromicropila herbilytica TaxID=2785025 RepID=A0A7R7IBM1_9FIRM|nr:hypothetical protein [Anaeromicropila herbilytica]BCN29752.1 hypothetical protein bsdtb5_10470 [Anaeromicropila herbilytica]
MIHVKKADIRPLDEDGYHILYIREMLQDILNCIKLKWMLDVNDEVHLFNQMMDSDLMPR